jgi:ribonuclease P protein component
LARPLLKGVHRIRQRRAFETTIRRGKRIDGPGFLLIATANGLGFGRLGIAVGRRVGTAVVRNRVKRIVREAFRGAQAVRAFGADFIVVVRNAGEMGSMSDVGSQLESRTRQMAARRWIHADEKNATLRDRGL